MDALIQLAHQASHKTDDLPFSIYSASQEQHILNVPILKPLLIAILQGTKQLGMGENREYQSGHFVFLPDCPNIEMRNIPKKNGYCALLIEFDYHDFEGLPKAEPGKEAWCSGIIDETMLLCLKQLIDWSCMAPKTLWPARRKEILNYLQYKGYRQLAGLNTRSIVSYQLQWLIQQSLPSDTPLSQLCDTLSMSESTLRRRLKEENTTLQLIKDNVKLGLGLHLLQTSHKPISMIAEACGYQSQSRFTDKFKARFGVTPSALRKSR